MSDVPEVKCSECGVTFSLIWNRQWQGQKPEFCPFCGEDWEDCIKDPDDPGFDD